MSESLKYHLKGGQQHAQLRSEIKTMLHANTNINLATLVKTIENRIKELTNWSTTNPLTAGIAFPVGIGVNNVAAHWSIPPNSTATLQPGDLITIDFGLHYHGYITDAAFSALVPGEGSRLPEKEFLLKVSQNATEIAIKASGTDVPLREIGSAIEEYVSSQEFISDSTGDNTIRPQVIKNLTGHKILPYQIHGFKQVPNYRFTGPYHERMQAGEIYALEPFVSLANSQVLENGTQCNHYMLQATTPPNSSALTKREVTLHRYLSQRYKTLCFNPDWEPNLDLTALQLLSNRKLVQKFPMLYVPEDDLVAQTEHNIYIRDSGTPLVLTKSARFPD